MAKKYDLRTKEGKRAAEAEKNVAKCIYTFASNGVGTLDVDSAEEIDFDALNKTWGENKKKAFYYP
jgi:hypothetical protein